MKFKIFIIMIVMWNISSAQIPLPTLVGYFQNWNSVNAPYVSLSQIDYRYNVIAVAFAIPKVGTDYDMEFVPQQVSQSQFISQIQSLQNQGKKVILSIGGGTAIVKLDDTFERDTFISSINSIINTYGFDGIDIDFEGTSVRVTSGSTIANPVDVPIVNLINAIKAIMNNYRVVNGEKMILTMAPETAYVQGGQSSYGGAGGVRGAYLPVLDALRDSIDILQVQLYNSGNMYGLDGDVYTQGTTDFIVAMVEAVIQGYNTQGGFFNGFPANKVVVALPSCSLAAGGGYVSPLDVRFAIDYLTGLGVQPGVYSLQNSSGYPDLLGMMTWSINWDALSSCESNYAFAQNFEDIFLGGQTKVNENNFDGCKLFPNPVDDLLTLSIGDKEESVIHIQISTISGEVVLKKEIKFMNKVEINVSTLVKGVYAVRIINANSIKNFKIIKN